MCAVTVDTQTAGDALRPAAYTGVVGFKPTIGWVTTEGSQPAAPTIDTIGVTARRVSDAAARGGGDRRRPRALRARRRTWPAAHRRAHRPVHR
jgi:hypothetical protein